MRPRSVGPPLVALALLAAPVSAPAGASGDPYVAGASGVGDPYYPLYGNGGYDVKHYDLKIAYEPSTDRLDAVAQISAEATQNLYRFNLDLQGLTVHAVVVDEDRASWSRAQDHELIITPEHRLQRGERFEVVVWYDGVPRTLPDGSGFIHTDSGALVVGQPEVAANWFPVNDHPIDKASYSFSVTVPSGLEVVANGHLVGHRTGEGSTTWEWRAREPMASYLATVNIGQFRVHSYHVNGLEMHDAIDPDLFAESVDPGNPSAPTFGDVAAKSFSRQGEIIDFLADIFGPYPFSSGGGIVDSSEKLLFALETQTRPIYSKFFFFDELSGAFVVVHEIAHQWVGDSVAIARWQHIWLNEGFASYAEWLWGESENLGTAQETFDSSTTTSRRTMRSGTTSSETRVPVSLPCSTPRSTFGGR